MVIYPLPTTLSFLSFVGYVVQGSNGEYVFLREEERVELVKRAAEMASPDKIIVAGAGCECKYMYSISKLHFSSQIINFPQKIV